MKLQWKHTMFDEADTMDKYIRTQYFVQPYWNALFLPKPVYFLSVLVTETQRTPIVESELIRS